MFTLIAGVACLQRLVSGAHFLSDIMGGVVITITLSLLYWKTPGCSTGDNDGEHSKLIPEPTALTIE